ncbi:MAG: hypothetical protein IPL67_01990 [Ignavibacteria bacterium]|nr:hypothetical protein [Ignavibacteria bacterium]
MLGIFFGKGLKTRLRPSFSRSLRRAQRWMLSVYCAKGKDAGSASTRMAGDSGCGMVDPNVFNQSDMIRMSIPGSNFGMGIERTLMVKYGILEIRIFYEMTHSVPELNSLNSTKQKQNLTKQKKIYQTTNNPRRINGEQIISVAMSFFLAVKNVEGRRRRKETAIEANDDTARR